MYILLKKPTEMASFIKAILIFLLAVLIGILSVNPTLVALSVVLVLSLLIVTFVFLRPDRFVYLLMLYVLFQNIIAMFLAKFAGNIASQAFILLKDVLTYLTLILVFVVNYKKNKNTFPDTFAILSAIVLLVYLLVPTNVSLFAKLVQFRQLFSPIVLYLLGRFMFIKKGRAETFLKFFVKISVLSVFFGLLERFILGDSFWLNIGIVDYMVSKGMGSWAYVNGGLPGNFYSYDFASFIGTSLRRMVSFIADPTLYGQFLVFPLSVLLFTDLFPHKQKIRYILILLLGLFLSLSKGGMLSFALVVLFKVFRSKYRPMAFFLTIILGVMILGVLTNAEKFSSLPNHIKGLTHNITLLEENPFGLGLGKSGNFAGLYSNGNDEEIGAGESYMGMIVGQLGIFSVPLFMFFITIVNIFRNNKDKTKYTMQYDNLFAAILIGTFSSSIISESAISFISAGIVFLMCGIFVTIKINNQGGLKNEHV